eukprot:419086_1
MAFNYLLTSTVVFIISIAGIYCSMSLDNWLIHTESKDDNHNISGGYDPHLSFTFIHGDYDEISINLNTKDRLATFEENVNYTVLCNYSFIENNKNKKTISGVKNYKGFPYRKDKCIAFIKKVFGEEAITVGDCKVFGAPEDPNYKKDYVRCNICFKYPTAMLKASHIKKAIGIFSEFGRRWHISKTIDHFAGVPHDDAVTDARTEQLSIYLSQNPQENPNNYTNNTVLAKAIQFKQDLYVQRLRHYAIVYNDMKCLTISANTFANRDLIESYVKHLIGLGSGPFIEYIPTPEQCRFNHNKAHQRYREDISCDVLETYIKPLMDDVLACGVGYDGWRAFYELYINGARFIFEDGTIRHIFIGLIDPSCGGADGCVEAFRIAYRRLFDTEQQFMNFMPKIVSQTTDKHALNVGSKNGANLKIRTDVIQNVMLPEFICFTHCGHNSWKDWLAAFGVVNICFIDHNNTVAFSHRGEIMKDYRKYCRVIIFINSPKEETYIPNRWHSGGTTRMASHTFEGMKTTHEGLDCWLLFLDDRSSNHSDSTTRFAALYQFQKQMNFKKQRINYLAMDCMKHYTIFDKYGQIVGIDVLEMSDIRD